MTALPTENALLAEPGPAPGWWEETPAEAARYDRLYWTKDEDS